MRYKLHLYPPLRFTQKNEPKANFHRRTLMPVLFEKTAVLMFRSLFISTMIDHIIRLYLPRLFSAEKSVNSRFRFYDAFPHFRLKTLL